MKNVADTRTALHLNGTLFYEAAFKFVGIRIDKLVDQDKDQLTAVDVH